jgi:hypothetical protein
MQCFKTFFFQLPVGLRVKFYNPLFSGDLNFISDCVLPLLIITIYSDTLNKIYLFNVKKKVVQKKLGRMFSSLYLLCLTVYCMYTQFRAAV